MPDKGHLDIFVIDFPTQEERRTGNKGPVIVEYVVNEERILELLRNKQRILDDVLVQPDHEVQNE